MKILLAGATGFLGRPLVAALASRGHEMVVLTRGVAARTSAARFVTWRADPSDIADAPWASELTDTDAVVNLAGEGIADKRWTVARKVALRESRILSTRRLVAAVRAASHRPTLFLNASGIGYYGDTGDQEIDESYPPGSDFLATLCVDWEAEAHAAEALGCRVALMRTGLVLAPDGGALAKLLPPFKFFAGGPIASGRQYMSWIHRDDWVAMMAWIIETPQAGGPFNGTAPAPVTNEAFSAALGRQLDRPSWLRMPRIGLRAIVGEIADVALVTGQRALPRRALDGGFRFTYERIEDALAACLTGVGAGLYAGAQPRD